MPENRVAIVTGASRGLGREVALRLGRAGFAVAVNYLNSRAEAEETAGEIIKNGGDALVYKADVRSYQDIAAMVDAVIERWGRVDVLVNNAGTAKEGLIVRLPEGVWDDALDTNLKGCFNTIKAVSKPMLKQRAGHIINISSIAGVRGKAGHAAYASAKAGLIGLTKAAAVELAPRGVQVNCVLPGYMLTGMGAAASEKTRDEALSDNLLKKFSDPAEVADFICNLVGMGAVSGQVFNLDSRVI